jgi:hypothetical protein
MGPSSRSSHFDVSLEQLLRKHLIRKPVECLFVVGEQLLPMNFWRTYALSNLTLDPLNNKIAKLPVKPDLHYFNKRSYKRMTLDIFYPNGLARTKIF